VLDHPVAARRRRRRDRARDQKAPNARYKRGSGALSSSTFVLGFTAISARGREREARRKMSMDRGRGGGGVELPSSNMSHLVISDLR